MMITRVCGVFCVVALVVMGCQSTDRICPATELAYVRLTDGLWQVWVIDSAGKHPKQLTSSMFDKRFPKWTTDGQGVLFRTNNGEAFLIEVESGKERRILRGLEPIGSVSPANMGSRVVFAKYKQTLTDASDIWLAEPEGVERRIVTNDPGLQYGPAASPDGRRIAYISGQGFGKHELHVMAADGTTKARLTENQALELLPAWRPDGGRLAYVSDVAGNYDVWAMTPDGQDKRQLTSDEALDSCPSWSPDGRSIAFMSTRSGSSQIWIMGADGSDPRQVTRGDEAMEPCWRRTNP